MEKKKKKISRIITVRLFIAVFAAFIISSAVTYNMLYSRCEEKADELLIFSYSGLVVDMKSSIEAELYNYSFSSYLDLYLTEGEDGFREILQGSNYSYVASKDGIIRISGNESFIGRNIRELQYVSGMLDDLFAQNPSAGTFYVTPCPVRTLDGSTELYYVLMVHPDMPDAVIAIAFNKNSYEESAQYVASNVSLNNNIGITGYVLMINKEQTILTPFESIDGDLYMAAFPYPELIEEYETGTNENIEDIPYQMRVNGESETTDNYKVMFGKGVFWQEECYYCLTDIYGIYTLCLYPSAEALEQVNSTIGFIILLEAIIFAVQFIVLRLLIKRRVVRKLDSVNASLDKITAGDLEEKVEVRDTYEFDTLSTDINATVDRLKEYIAEAAARIDADLAVAKAIQSSALPNVFPPFPERKEFELFASMSAAKEVGGDFYDFYMLNDHTLGFLIADVSGKSIPGAMFMMTSKTVIKSLAESGLPPAEVFSIANEKLCEGNEAEMFVTAWLGYLDLNTGLVRIANAGHNPPVLIHGGKAEYVILKPGLMLAGMDGVRYKELTLQLEKGDILYLYTDGVTEAMDKDEEQYGEDRLQKLLSFGENYPAPSAANGIAETVCDMVTADVTKFTNGAEQSDDITMLCVRFLGGE